MRHVCFGYLQLAPKKSSSRARAAVVCVVFAGGGHLLGGVIGVVANQTAAVASAGEGEGESRLSTAVVAGRRRHRMVVTLTDRIRAVAGSQPHPAFAPQDCRR